MTDTGNLFFPADVAAQLKLVCCRRCCRFVRCHLTNHPLEVEPLLQPFVEFVQYLHRSLTLPFQLAAQGNRQVAAAARYLVTVAILAFPLALGLERLPTHAQP